MSQDKLRHSEPHLREILARSASDHSHLCPRQVLGVRMALAGRQALGLPASLRGKRLLVIVESDGCFADGIKAATGCTVGHRTLRIEDYGKIAATFVDTRTARAVRLAPRLDVRERSARYAPEESRRYFAQLVGYQRIPVSELLAIEEVELSVPIEAIISRPGVRVNCSVCGEEIINERELLRGDQVLCRSCAFPSYYRPSIGKALFLSKGRSMQFSDRPALNVLDGDPV